MQKAEALAVGSTSPVDRLWTVYSSRVDELRLVAGSTHVQSRLVSDSVGDGLHGSLLESHLGSRHGHRLQFDWVIIAHHKAVTGAETD